MTTPYIIFSKKHCSFMRPCVAENYGFIRYELPFINALAVEVPAEKAENLKRHHLVAMMANDSKVSKLPLISSDFNPPSFERTSETQRDMSKSSLALRVAETRGFGITIAVIDTGTAPHYDLVKPHNRIVVFKDFLNHRTKPYDDDGHGTHVAGIAAGNAYASGGGFDARFGHFAGTAPMANIAALKVLDENGNGAASDILAAMQWVADNKERYNIRIVNLSLGVHNYSEHGIDPLTIAVTALTALGIVVITAAGNSGPDCCTIASPGIAPAAITVGACHNGEVAMFSSRGPTLQGIQKPDLVAPGVGIVSLDAATGKTYIAESGTSMACPYVSGMAACILSADPSLSPQQVKRVLYKMLRPLPGMPRNAQGRGALVL